MNNKTLIRYTTYDDLGNKVWVNGKITEEFAEYYARKNCRKCLSRGRLLYDNPRNGQQWEQVCDCVIRAYKKEERALFGAK